MLPTSAYVADSHNMTTELCLSVTQSGSLKLQSPAAVSSLQSVLRISM